MLHRWSQNKNKAQGTTRVKHKMRLRWRQRYARIKQGLFILPHLFTFGNAFFGFSSLIFSAHGEYTIAAYLVLFGALMDMLDGRVARYLGVTSMFGVQIDSFSDALSFCCAPAFLLYMSVLNRLGIIGAMISFLFVMAGIIRLARFNLIHEKQTFFFLGLPSTMAGCFLVTFLLNIQKVHRLFFVLCIALLMIVLSGLMVSALPFPAFKQRLFKNKKNGTFIMLSVVFAILAVMRVHTALLFLFLLYFTYAAYYAFGHYRKQYCSNLERQQA